LSEIEPFIGRTLGGKYRIDALLGQGSMGTVFRATQLALERLVAIKVLRSDLVAEPAALERFRREALAVARLAHPNIVTVHHFDVEPGLGTYIVMELLQGQSLRDLLDRRVTLPFDLAIRLMRDVCSAVQAAHDAGLVHRDLKPDNIFVVDHGDGPSAKVLDFGVAKLRETEDSTEDALTATGHVLGTPYYMSPEQCLGDEVDARSDVYALGCVLYEMVAGSPPFDSTSAVAVMQRHVSASPVPIREVAPQTPTAVARAIHRALSKRPHDRFASVAQFADALGADGDGTQPVGATHAANTRSSQRAVIQNGATREMPRSSPSNASLPQYLTTFVGREETRAEASELLAFTRLLTLTGPGGIGKTRLATEVAADLAPRFQRVRVVELAALTDPSLVAKAVAAALDVAESSSRTPEDALVGSIGDARVLLLIDNCEHLVDACATLASRLLRACSALHILATSREAFGVAGETVRPVVPLAIPPDGASIAEITRSEAVRLFSDRAVRGTPKFTLSAVNVPLVAAICRRLDGIPLAIELAAARVKILSLRQILERLEDRFRLLTGGDRSSFPHQHTLRATIDWSFDLLTDTERVLLARLSVFSGGWTLDDAERVAGNDESEKGSDVHPSSFILHPSQILDLLARLVDKSLVNVTHDDEAEPRHSMLETIRAYAAEKLAESGDEASVRARHAARYAALAGKARREHMGSGLAPWLARLDIDHDNIRQALSFLLAEDAVAALRLCCSIGWFWNIRGHLAEGRRWFAKALDACANAPEELLAEALHEAANLVERQGDLAEARSLYERSLDLRRTLGDRPGIALSLHNLGINATDRGDYERAVALHRESADLFREVGDTAGLTITLNGIAVAERYRGNFDEAYSQSLECLAMCRTLGSERGVGIMLFNLGSIAFVRDDLDEAERRLGEGLAVGRSLGERALEANALDSLATIARKRGALDRAATLCAEGLDIRRRMGDLLGISASLAGLAQIAASRDDAERTVALGAAAIALRESIGGGTGDFDEEALQEAIRESRDRLGAGGDVAYTEGKTMGMEQAISYGFETAGFEPEP
jgi:predicted ATPase/serine/threonine protein kinase